MNERTMIDTHSIIVFFMKRLQDRIHIMELLEVNEVDTFLPLLPAILMLALVIFTRKIVLSLGTGIFVGALIYTDFSIGQTFKTIWMYFYQIFYSDGSLETSNLLLLGFLLLLGIMTALLAASGGSQAFGDWMIQKVKTRTGAQMMPIILGLVIFIDDYFNSLAVGQVARPLTDRHKISRAKLAYYIDSTSAPVTVISPISSWGAFIIGILGSLFAANHITDMKPLTSFIQMIPYNFYAIAALLIVFLVALFKFDIGPMKKHEDRAIRDNQLVDPDPKKANIPGDLNAVFTPHKDGRVYHLLIPIIILLVVTITLMIWTGILNTEDKITFLHIFENTDVNVSLFTGGLLSVIVGFMFHFQQKSPKAKSMKIFVEGIKTMLPAISILILAWMIGSTMGDLKTGEHLANIVQSSSIQAPMLPFIFFIIAGIMSLATGTSWGTFSIMLPIGAEVALNLDMSLLLPVLSAVLAGSVFGDHCTPISDTTILSSTGAGANHIDHVITQLPYAFIAALAAGLGYLSIGVFGNVWISLVIVIAIPIIISWINRVVGQKKQTNIH